MNNQDINKICNLISRYYIEDMEENFEKIKLVIKQKKFILHSEIFDFVNNCRTIAKTFKKVITEIDSEEYSDLLKDINKNFFIKKLNQRAEKKKLDTDTNCKIYS